MRNKCIDLVAGLVVTAGVMVGAELSGTGGTSPVPNPGPEGLSPTALAVSPDETTLFVACASAGCVGVFDLASKRLVRTVAVPPVPLGLALTRDGARLYVACAASVSTVCVVEAGQGRIIAEFRVGHTAMAPVLSRDEKTLYVCNRFNDDVSVIDLVGGRESQRIRMVREPVAAALTPDGRFLLVANHFYRARADLGPVEAAVSVIATASGQVVKAIPLPEGSGLARGITVSPDGRYGAVTHLRSRHWVPTYQADQGGINANAVSLVDLDRMEFLGTVLLDQFARGAANPWGIAWTPDSRTIAVTLAGTHELCLIEAPTAAETPGFSSLFLSSIGPVPEGTPPPKPVRVRRRVALEGNGPRALAVAGSRIYVANYFSDNLCRIDLTRAVPVAEPLALAPEAEPSLVRKGEQWFNDATLCRQGWQSCASCHDADGRMDALNWDLLNDGVHNPKNTKSLLWAHQTPPAMALGERASAEVAVRAGIHHILFTEQPEEVPAAMDEYLKSLQPIPSPRLVEGRLSAVAERGRAIFFSSETGCTRCHAPPRWTDLRRHDVGTLGRYDQPTDRLDTPALVELWRTAPYLHDGSALTLREVLTSRNRGDQHGTTSRLTSAQFEDLTEYLLSL